MATTVILPKQGQSVESCIITEWYKKKGDKVEKGDLLFAYETDKSSFEEEAQVDGILLEMFYEEGDEVPVLSEVAVIGAEGEKVEVPQGNKDKVQESSESQNTEEPLAQASTSISEEASLSEEAVLVSGTQKTKISPRARKMAEVRGIQVENIPGTGPNGRIIVRDIEALGSGSASTAPASAPVTESVTPKASPSSAPSSAPLPPSAAKAAPPAAPKAAPVMSGDYEDRPLSNLRKLVAKAMHASLQNSAQLTHHLSADVRSLLSLRKKVKKSNAETGSANITLNDMISFAVIRALKKHPGANTHFIGENVRFFKNVHLGIAVDTERGLMVPVIRNADDLSLAGLSNQIAKLAAACRSGSIDPDLLQPDAATFTISNLGNYGVEMFTPVINLPQAGILGVNTIIERPARTEDGTFGFIPYMGLSLTYDHRVLDGGPATLFLAEIKREIEQFNHELINL